MSRKPTKPPSKERLQPKPTVSRSQTSRPSIASARSSTFSQKTSTASKPSTSAAKKPTKEWDLPALSLPYKPKITESEFEKLKKRTIRRNAPPGEDLKQIRNILKSIKGQDVSVNEFISLIAPSTGDHGEVLRKVMNDDLNSFRKLARKVYETITKDNSDVLLNQQLQLAEYYKERKNILHEKMMRFVEEIYLMAPNFDFERYSKEKEAYLKEIIPIPEELQVEPEELEMLKRHAAYHRLQWLRSEGERLNEENNSLKKRLNHLKRTHKEELERMLQMEREAEAKKEKLEATQAQKVEELDKLHDSLELSIIKKEKDMRINQDKALLEPLPKKQVKKKKSKGAVRKRRPPWNETAAKELEAQASEKSEFAAGARVTSPFHFSPVKTPPQKATTREVSPFHYSPPKYEEARHVGAPQQQDRPRSSSLQQPRPSTPPRRFYGRHAPAPRDTWGGFY